MGISVGLPPTLPLPPPPPTCSMSHWRELRVLGVCFMAARYLRLRAADGREEHLGRPPLPAACAPYTCTAERSSLRKPGECGALLFDQRDILSREHCWDAGGGPERAFFINGFAPGAVAVRYEREELLCQVRLTAVCGQADFFPDRNAGVCVLAVQAADYIYACCCWRGRCRGPCGWRMCTAPPAGRVSAGSFARTSLFERETATRWECACTCAAEWLAAFFGRHLGVGCASSMTETVWLQVGRYGVVKSSIRKAKVS